MARSGNATTAATATKKQKGSGGSGQASVPNRELLQRMNFLHQASVLVAGAANDSARLAARVEAQSSAQGIRQSRRNSVSLTPKSRTRHSGGQGLIATQVEPAIGSKSNVKDSSNSVAVDASASTPGPANTPTTSAHIATPAESPNSPAPCGRRYSKVSFGPPYMSDSPALSIGEVLSLDVKEPDKAAGKERKLGGFPPVWVRKKRARHNSSVSKNLSTHFVQDIQAIARKSVLRIDPNIKRTMCRNCKTALVPGVTSSVRILPSGPHVHLQRTKCLACGVTRALPCPPLLGTSNSLAGPEDSETNMSNTAQEEGPEIKTAVSSVEESLARHHSQRSIVPGTAEQHKLPNFHERLEHPVWRGYERVGKTNEVQQASI